MARFRGTVQGGRGEASRLGHGTCGLRTVAQSYSGDVLVSLYDHEGEDHVRISIGPHAGWSEVTLYEGSIADILNKNKHAAIVQATIKALAPHLLVA